jgi:DNA polymerase III epsilon subunit-like protein
MRTVAFDLETTGRARDCEIVSIGWADSHGGSGEAFAMPRGPIDPFAVKIHGLSRERLVELGAGSLKDALQAFLGALEGEPLALVAHNGKSFDTRHLRSALAASGLHLPENVVVMVDTLLWARRVFKNERCSLDALMARFGIRADRDLHGAELDSVLLLKVHDELSKHGSPPDAACETVPAWLARTVALAQPAAVVEAAVVVKKPVEVVDVQVQLVVNALVASVEDGTVFLRFF